MQPHQILSRQTLIHSRVFDVQKLLLRLPDGREQDYDVVAHAPAVTLLPIGDQGEVYFVSQYRVGAEDTLLELPAGVIDPGEEPAVSARRELREEIGMDCQELTHLGSFYMAAGYSTEYMHIFLASGLIPSPLKQDDDEFLTLSALPLDEVYRMAFSGQIQDGKTLSALLLALPLLREKYPRLLVSL